MSPVVRESRRGAQTVYREVLRKSCRTLKTRGRSMGPYGIEYKRIRAMGRVGCVRALILPMVLTHARTWNAFVPAQGRVSILRGGGWALIATQWHSLHIMQCARNSVDVIESWSGAVGLSPCRVRRVPNCVVSAADPTCREVQAPMPRVSHLQPSMLRCAVVPFWRRSSPSACGSLCDPRGDGFAVGRLARRAFLRGRGEVVPVAWPARRAQMSRTLI